MKLFELLDRLDSEEYPYYADTPLLEELGIYPSWVSLKGHGFTCRTIEVWNCTDTSVGTEAIYHNGGLICITRQNARKSSVEFMWVSKDAYKKTKDFVNSLVIEEEDPITTIDLDEEVNTTYGVAYTGQLIRGHHDKPIYEGRVVEIDWDSTIRLGREDVLANEAWVVDGNELKKVPVSELALPIPLK